MAAGGHESVSKSSKEQPAMAQRSDEGREEWAAEQDGCEQESNEELGGGGGGGGGEEGVGLPSQRMHSKGAQGNQTRSLPVSM